MLSTTVYSCGDDVLETKIDEEIVLMSISKGEYFSLGEVASRIWELLKTKPLDVDSLCAALQQEYDIDRTTCLSDTEDFLKTLVEQNLVKALVIKE
jgi:hypothetical protein